jgi:hypothetical protein
MLGSELDRIGGEVAEDFAEFVQVHDGSEVIEIGTQLARERAHVWEVELDLFRHGLIQAESRGRKEGVRGKEARGRPGS